MLLFVKQGFAWLAVAVCAIYGGWAIWVASAYLVQLADVGVAVPDRSAPPLFVLHAFTGGVALIAGSVQLNLADKLLRTRRSLHRAIGRSYLATAWVTSLGGLGITALFDVNLLAKIGFGLEAVLWFAATTIGFGHIRRGHVRRHREWMIRSFSLALFVVTFGLTEAVWEGMGISAEIGYPLSGFSWCLNLAAAEWWIRHTRSRSESAAAQAPTEVMSQDHLPEGAVRS